jgi:hypothetical protein
MLGGQGHPTMVCQASLALRSVNGAFIALQDQGAPGHDHCDMRHPESYRRGPVLLFDCHIVSASTTTPETIPPNRADRECGQGG